MSIKDLKNMPSEITINEVVDYLNKLVETDKLAIAALVENRVHCKEELDCVTKIDGDGNHHVGLLGVLNGLFNKSIMGIYKEGDFQGFEVSYQVRQTSNT